MSDEPQPKRQRRPPRRFPWCDGRFRCVHCPKALGRDGRGYSRARDVPCSNPDLHLTVSDKDNCDRYWLSDPNAVHFDLPLGRELNRSTGDAAKPGPEGWCSCCDPHDQFLNGRLHAISHTIPLDAHVGPWPQHWDKHEAALRLEPSAPPQRARRVQLPWCDGLYRCVTCCPTGQPRPISSKQCSNPAAHMPTGLRGQYVHFLSSNPEQNALRTGDPKLLEVSTMRTEGCGQCANDGLAFPPSSDITRWGGM
jgi:hypothetical protein